jgi:hypothetical protein
MKYFKIYWKCPEIRAEMRKQMLANTLVALSIIMLSPLVLLGFISMGFAYVFEVMMNFFMAGPSYVFNYLKEYSIEQTGIAHSKLTVAEIKKRIGMRSPVILPKEDQDEDF